MTLVEQMAAWNVAPYVLLDNRNLANLLATAECPICHLILTNPCLRAPSGGSVSCDYYCAPCKAKFCWASSGTLEDRPCSPFKVNIAIGVTPMGTGSTVQKLLEATSLIGIQGPSRSCVYKRQAASTAVLEAIGEKICNETCTAYVKWSKEKYGNHMWVAGDGCYTTCRNAKMVIVALVGIPFVWKEQTYKRPVVGYCIVKKEKFLTHYDDWTGESTRVKMIEGISNSIASCLMEAQAMTILFGGNDDSHFYTAVKEAGLEIKITLDGDVKNKKLMEQMGIKITVYCGLWHTVKSAKKLFRKEFLLLERYAHGLLKYLVFCVHHCVTENKSEQEFQVMWHTATYHHAGDHRHCQATSKCKAVGYKSHLPPLASTAEASQFKGLLGCIVSPDKNYLACIADSTAESLFKTFQSMDNKRIGFNTTDKARFSMTIAHADGDAPGRHKLIREATRLPQVPEAHYKTTNMALSWTGTTHGDPGRISRDNNHRKKTQCASSITTANVADLHASAARDPALRKAVETTAAASSTFMKCEAPGCKSHKGYTTEKGLIKHIKKFRNDTAAEVAAAHCALELPDSGLVNANRVFSENPSWFMEMETGLGKRLALNAVANAADIAATKVAKKTAVAAKRAAKKAEQTSVAPTGPQQLAAAPTGPQQAKKKRATQDEMKSSLARGEAIYAKCLACSKLMLVKSFKVHASKPCRQSSKHSK